MTPAKLLLMMGQTRRFIGAAGGAQSLSGDVAIPYPTGARVGDLAFVFVSNASGPGSLSTSGWSSVNPPAIGGVVYWKVLATADLSATAGITAGPGSNTLYTMVFRGFTGASNRTNQGEQKVGGASTSKTWAGFTKGAGCKALLLFMAVNADSTTQEITSPVMSAAVADPSAGNSTGQSQVRIVYNLTPSQYTDATSVTETFGASWTQVCFAAFSLT